MGKQMSKTSGGWQTRRQRSQVMSEPTVVSSPEPPRILPESPDRAMLTLKLQKDELKMYRSRVITALRREDDIIKRLLKEGKKERAKLLLKKSRFQKHILHETEAQLNSIFTESNTQDVAPEIRKQVHQTIDQNCEAMKKLHILLSLENVELMLKETYEGSKKQSEVNQLLLLASLGERDILEKDLEQEMEKMLGVANDAQRALNVNNKEEIGILEPSKTEAKEDVQKLDENELEELVSQKLKERNAILQSIAEQIDARKEGTEELATQNLDHVLETPLAEGPEYIRKEGTNMLEQLASQILKEKIVAPEPIRIDTIDDTGKENEDGPKELTTPEVEETEAKETMELQEVGPLDAALDAYRQVPLEKTDVEDPYRAKLAEFRHPTEFIVEEGTYIVAEPVLEPTSGAYADNERTADGGASLSSVPVKESKEMASLLPDVPTQSINFQKKANSNGSDSEPEEKHVEEQSEIITITRTAADADDI